VTPGCAQQHDRLALQGAAASLHFLQTLTQLHPQELSLPEEPPMVLLLLLLLGQICCWHLLQVQMVSLV
jgi:hypothetical protein